jgi:hypothetical protein
MTARLLFGKALKNHAFLKKQTQYYQKRSSKNTKIKTSPKTNPLATDNQN